MYLNIVLNWPEDGRLRPKHVAKYNLIVIIASPLDVCCVWTVHNMLYKFNNIQGDGLSQILSKIEICVFIVSILGVVIRRPPLLLTNTLLTNPGEAVIIRNSIGVLVNLQVPVGNERIPHSLHLFANPRLWLGSCLFVPDVTSYTISVSPATLI